MFFGNKIWAFPKHYQGFCSKRDKNLRAAEIFAEVGKFSLKTHIFDNCLCLNPCRPLLLRYTQWNRKRRDNKLLILDNSLTTSFQSLLIILSTDIHRKVPSCSPFIRQSLYLNTTAKSFLIHSRCHPAKLPSSASPGLLRFTTLRALKAVACFHRAKSISIYVNTSLNEVKGAHRDCTHRRQETREERKECN